MSSPALQAHLDSAGEVLDDPPAFLPWDRSYCCCDCCLQVRDSRGVVAIHPVLKVSPHKKIWVVQVRWMRRLLRHTRGWSVGQGNAAVAMPMIRLRCGEWYHPAGTTGGPWRPLSVDQVVSGTCQAPVHIARCWLSQTARFCPRTRMVQWCHVWRWQPRQCTSQSVMAFTDSAQGVCYPRRCCS